MSSGVALRLGLTLTLMFGFGLASVASAPAGDHIGFMWPVGLASAALLLVPRDQVRYVALAVAVLAATSFDLGGYSFVVSLGCGIAVAVEAVVVREVLTAGGTRRAALRDNADFGRFMVACALGAFGAALIFTVIGATSTSGTSWKVGLSAFVTHTAIQIVLVGIFVAVSSHPAAYGVKERAAAWVNNVVVTTVAFIPTDIPSLAFLVVPGLGWIALRGTMREALIQLIGVSTIAAALTSWGYGPFSDPYLVRNLDPEFTHLHLQAFLFACAMVAIPFSVAVGMQRRSAAEALLERGRTEQMVESTHGIAIVGTDEHGRINLFNPGAERILGYTFEEVRGRSTAMFHTDAEIARLCESFGAEPTYPALVAAMRDLPPGPARDLEFIRKDGAPRILSTIINPIHDEDGAMVGDVAIADDVTDRIDTQTALETALESEREAVERLTQVDQVKDLFVSSVSHELRTPITNIVGYLELLLDGAYGEPANEQKRALSRVEANSRRLLTLIDDLLTLSSMESLDQPRTIAPVDLVHVIRRSEEMVRPGLMHRDLRLEVDVPDQPVVIAGDASQLERVVINLATNAVKFTLDGGRVTLRLIAPANGTGPVIEVEDTGIGIPEGDQEMLFSRFFRAAQAREAAVPGSGLGLSIAKSIVELHGGEISATSVYGSGSLFRVEFPADAASPS